jgi:cytochrome P450
MSESQADAAANRGGIPLLNENPFDPAVIADPYPFYARLRAAGPVYFPPAEVWMVGRYADARQVLRDPRFGHSGAAGLEEGLGAGPLAESFARWMLFRNPPDHTRLRALVSQAFTPRTVAVMQGEIQRLVDELLDRVPAGQTFDLIAALAYPLPVLVVCALLGVPAADRDGLRQWSADLAGGLDSLGRNDPQVIAAGNAAAAGLTDYFRGLVAERRRAPGEDLLSGLVAAREQGDRLSADELLATCVLLFFAGHETTVNLIGNGTLALLRHPDQLARLRADPELGPRAVEELLRYDGPVQRIGRTLLADAEVGGRALPAGTTVLALVGAANRDPAAFDDPERLDVARADNRHLAFSAGAHYCVGAPLARLEAQLAITTLLRRLPGLRLETEAPSWRPMAVLRGLRSLPVSA